MSSWICGYIAVRTESSKVFKFGCSAQRPRLDVIHVQNAMGINGRVVAAQHAPESVSLKHFKPEAERHIP